MRTASLRPLASLCLAATLAACTASAGRSGYVRAPAYGGDAPLVAGVTDDNVRLPEYLDYVRAYPHGDVPKLDLTDRQIVTVLDHDRRPLWNEVLEVDTPTGPFRARTNAAGSVLIPRAALGLSDASLICVGGGDGQWLHPDTTEVLAPSRWRRDPRGVRLDVALAVDTTGSMADEVARLRTTLKSVVAGLRSHPLSPRVRVGGVAYRDVGDAYVTRPFDFTDDLGAVQRRLDELDTGGGGDEPEAVQEALTDAVDRLSWGGEGTVRVLFLIGDAPPHFERGTPYTVTMRRAVEKGITIFPVACSGMNDTGEFVWRQLAAVTQGQFLFVSYDGGTDHHTDLYLENDLDVLMKRAVLAQLDALASGAPAIAPVLVPTGPGLQASGLLPENVYAPPFGYVPMAPTPSAPSATLGRARDRIGMGRWPRDFTIPGWQR